MKGFNFEKNLSHQTRAVNSTVAVFEHVEIKDLKGVNKNYVNPVFNRVAGLKYQKNILRIQEENGLVGSVRNRQSNIIDIMMETGTGKTYTYTKTIFELDKNYGIFKFVVIVPTLSIKAGTIDFLKSPSAREHFKEQYGKSINLHIVESQKRSKSKKSYIPPAISSFVNAGNYDRSSIQVLVINAGMINSETMRTSFDRELFDKYTTPFEAITAVNPFVIVDEPHKFDTSNKTWKNITQMQPQMILRYGATFPDKEIGQKNDLTGKVEKIKVKDYHNLIYTLSAVDSFNRNLVKGIIGHVTEFEDGKNALLRFVASDGKEATFELNDNGRKTKIKLAKKESFQAVHEVMTDLFVENLNKSTVVLSNGLQMKKGDKINPFSYAQTLQEIMLQKTIKNHFKIEKELITRDVKIKPISLFFIDNIDEYRGKDGFIKKTVESLIRAEVEVLLKTETNSFYKAYLEKTLADISLTHAGYFSKDNSEKDEVIEKEINEILHDKHAILDLNNTRRFIFSKWTLREGWDNPNVFQICKLRSSGSDISKLQEVGRGLRLPVNEYGNRVKEEQFFLNYFVDFTENDFVDSLVKEINEKSGAISMEDVSEKLTDNHIKKIFEIYGINENDLLELLDEKNLITRSNKFKDGGYDYIKNNYPLIFEGVGSNKVRKSTDAKKRVSVRTEKYQELKELWEKLNEKVILEYKFDNEAKFKNIFTDFLKAQKNNFNIKGVRERTSKIVFEDQQAYSAEEISVLDDNIIPISTLKYSDFLRELSKSLNINLKTIHQSLIESDVDINQYLNSSTIRIIKQNFDSFLMYNALDKFSIEYKRVTNSIHPTKLTDKSGNVKTDILASDVGVFQSNEKVADSYFFDELFFDSELEKKNIHEDIKEVVVFTKIPKNSIKIPVAGGKTYSPDFAYVVDFKDGRKKLHFIVETKHVEGEEILRHEEMQKIKHAEAFFNGNVEIQFKTQFSNDTIVSLIKDLV
jgi:type III restriction enzyme